MTMAFSSPATNSSTPKVIIAGGGPAGLLAAILLVRRCHTNNISILVLERAGAPDEWSTKSYSIVLNERGQKALEEAGCLESVRAQGGMRRTFVIMHDSNEKGKHTLIPKKVEGLGFSRPFLVNCLENIIRDDADLSSCITIQKGASVTGIALEVEEESRDANHTTHSNNIIVNIALDDGSTSTVYGTHVIGADGKWSNVRQSIPELNQQATIQTLPTFGVHIIVPTIPDGWEINGTHVFKPKTGLFYIIAAPIPTGELSVSIVCYNETLEQCPWLAPPSDDEQDDEHKSSWEDEYSAMPSLPLADPNDASITPSISTNTLAEKLEEWFEQEVPAFLEDIGREALQTARINRRVTWLEMNAANDNNDGDDNDKEAVVDSGSGVKYSTKDGRIALIGDSAHAMAPSMGEGCNTALESAYKLVACLVPLSNDVEKVDVDAGLEENITATTTTVNDLSDAFIKYGMERPKETQPVQSRSANAAKWQAATKRLAAVAVASKV